MKMQDKILFKGLTMDQHIERETRRRKVKFWGDHQYIQPVIHPTGFGDGKQLAFMATIDQRPNYWLIRIDSGIDVSADDFDYEKHLLQPLEDNFGRYPEQGFISSWEFKDLKKENHTSVADYKNYGEYKADCKYPAVYWGGGRWGSIAIFK